MSELAGRVAVITGASSGIGRGVAEELDRAGMSLVLTARRSDRLDALERRLESVAVLAGDITDAALPQRVIDLAISTFGRCDVVFNNAGIMDTGSVEDADIDRLCLNVRVNLEAAVRMAYAAVRHFKRHGSGYLINTSSVLGTKVRPTAGVYAGTKHAIEAVTEALRMELAGSGVRVSCVEPGLVMTELQDRFEVHPRDLLRMEHPLEPGDIARVVRFLLEQPRHVTIPRIMILPAEQPM